METVKFYCSQSVELHFTLVEFHSRTSLPKLGECIGELLARDVQKCFLVDAYFPVRTQSLELPNFQVRQKIGEMNVAWMISTGISKKNFFMANKTLNLK